MACILEQTLPPMVIESQLLSEETGRWPGWETKLKLDSDVDPLAEREESEWSLADRIIYGSTFVGDGLRSLGVDALKCLVVPYGLETQRFHVKKIRTYGSGLNLLFVGQIGLRKGVPYLLEALRLLNSNQIHCRLVGNVDLDRKRLAEYSRWMEIIGPVPRTRILEMYHWADLFVFPSLCEGFALVLIEALACGLPIITTPNSGSVVRDGEDGFIVPIRDAEGLATRIEQLLMDRRLLFSMSQNALKRTEDFTLERYGERLVEVIRSLYSG
jgi:glycosyltransferase involved in cell wall biosynthesis